MNAPETRERELAPLRKIRDSYEKMVIVMDCDMTQTEDYSALERRTADDISIFHIDKVGIT